jgi:hypothetical protein
MFNIDPIYLIFLLHFVGDFIGQNEWMASNKSKNTVEGISALTYHVFLYFAWLCWMGCLWRGVAFSPNGLYGVLVWAGTNGVCHWVVDFVSSRISSNFWKQKKVRPFFITIGADQTIHLMFLYWSWKVIMGGL